MYPHKMMPKVKTKTHRQIPIAFKLKAVHFFEKNGHNISKTAKTFGVDRKCIRNWVRNHDKLINQSKKTARFRVNYQNKCGLYPQMEEMLSNVIKLKRATSGYVDAATVQAQAKVIMDELYPKNTFKASKGWLNGFLNREKLVLRRISSCNKDVPANINSLIKEFHQTCTDIVRDTKIKCIINMDETCIYLDTPWKHSYDNKSGKRKVVHKCKRERKHIAVAFTAAADGSKLKPLIIIPQKRPIENYTPPDNVVVCYLPTGKFNENIFCNEWIPKVLMSHIMENDLKGVQLILDNAPFHKTVRVRSMLEQNAVNVNYVPTRTVNLLQPATVSWMKALKGLYYQKWSNWYLTEETSYSKLGMAKLPNFAHAIQWISEIWEQLPAYILFTSFQLCGITCSNEDSYHETLSNIIRNGPLNDYIDDYDDAIDGDLVDSFSDDVNEEEDKILINNISNISFNGASLPICSSLANGPSTSSMATSSGVNSNNTVSGVTDSVSLTNHAVTNPITTAANTIIAALQLASSHNGSSNSPGSIFVPVLLPSVICTNDIIPTFAINNNNNNNNQNFNISSNNNTNNNDNNNNHNNHNNDSTQSTQDIQEERPMVIEEVDSEYEEKYNINSNNDTNHVQNCE